MARFIKKADLKGTILSFFEKGQNLNADEKSKDFKAKELGVEAALTVIEKAADEGMENEFYALIAGVAEKTPEDIKNMSIEALLEAFGQIAKENNLAVFFKAAYQSAEKLAK